MSTPRNSAILLVLLLAACGGEEPPPAVQDAGVKPAFEPKATAAQEQALANALHKKHVESTPPVECAECHRIVGRGVDQPKKHRCLGCHQENESAIHAKVASAKATECLSCHDFLAELVDPWTCATCHVEGGAPKGTKTPTAAPQVKVHAKEWCGNCHVPHGSDALDPRPCLDCHDDKAARHRKVELTGAEQCVECHAGHQPAKVAARQCATCHKDDVATGPALFEGHDGCLTCHTPHDAPARVKACSSCHEGVQILGAAEAKEHRECSSCHDPHRVKQAPLASCQGCHKEITAKHSPHEKMGQCAGCHPIHPGEGQRLVKASRCSSCHDQAKTETSFHAGGLACSSCHVAHEFDLRQAGAQLCNSCHGVVPAGTKRLGDSVKVKPVEGHTDCAKCHVQGAHAPSKSPVACGKCHEPQLAAITPGHENCVQCHAPHEGSVGKQCLDCHLDVSKSRHSVPKMTAKCNDCHRPHGPEGPAQPKACVECHTQALPGMHQHPEHKTCSDCHDFHDKGPRRGRTSCLEPCHQNMVNHEPKAQSCRTCHPFGDDQ